MKKSVVSKLCGTLQSKAEIHGSFSANERLKKLVEFYND